MCLQHSGFSQASGGDNSISSIACQTRRRKLDELVIHWLLGLFIRSLRMKIVDEVFNCAIFV